MQAGRGVMLLAWYQLFVPEIAEFIHGHEIVPDY